MTLLARVSGLSQHVVLRGADDFGTIGTGWSRSRRYVLRDTGAVSGSDAVDVVKKGTAPRYQALTK